MTAAIHAETADAPCPTCGAPAGERCTVTDLVTKQHRSARIPCLARLQAGHLEPLEQQVCSRCLQPVPALVGRICPDCAATQPTLDEPERYP